MFYVFSLRGIKRIRKKDLTFVKNIKYQRMKKKKIINKKLEGPEKK